MKIQLRLRSVLVLINITLILLPLTSVFLLPFFDQFLLRQTESELLHQGSVLAATYKQMWIAQAPNAERPQGRFINEKSALPYPVEFGPWRPITTTLQYNRAELRPVFNDELPKTNADPAAARLGVILAPIVVETQNTSLAGIRITDFNGVVIAGTENSIGRSLVPFEEVQSALRGETSKLLRLRDMPNTPPSLTSISRRAEFRVHVALPVIVNQHVVGVVTVFRTPMDTLQAAVQHLPLLYPFLFWSVLIIVVMSLLVSYVLLRPLRALLNQVNNIRTHQNDAFISINQPVIREFGELSLALTDMSTKLQQRSKYIQQFVGQISHELKSPLMVIKGATELLQDHSGNMPQEQQQVFLASIMQEAVRMEKLSSRLIDLARADTFNIPLQSGRLRHTLLAMQNRFRDQFSHFTMALPDDEIMVMMNEEFIESVFINLIDNAAKYGGESLHISVTLYDNNVQVDVCDDGPGIPADKQKSVFQAFYTTGKNRGGTGLGLNIVSALLQAHHGSISIAVHDGFNCCFRLQFALAKQFNN